MRWWKAAVLGSVIATVSCLGSNEEEKYSKLFDAPRTATVTENSIHGVWGASVSQQDVTADWRVAFEADVVHVALRCRFKDGTRLTPGVTIPVTYGDTTVKFAHPAESTMKANSGTTCTVSVAGGTWPYQIVDNTLPMSISDRTLEFTKISD